MMMVMMMRGQNGCKDYNYDYDNDYDYDKENKKITRLVNESDYHGMCHSNND